MSELRRDPVSGEWIIIAPGRAKRPHDFKSGILEKKVTPIEECPFEDLSKSGNEPLVLFPAGSDKVGWKIAVIPNKYPILQYAETCPVPIARGPYSVLEGKGHHEIVITRDHDKNFPKLNPEEAFELMQVFKSRYEEIAKDECVHYTSFFHAWGPNAGASVYHPHYQILALPIIPPDIARSLTGSEKYFEKNGKCVHCEVIESEKKEGTRVVFENEQAIVVAPFISRQPFELRVFPKSHESHFAKSSDELLKGVSEALQNALQKLEKNLGDPDYNFFIHTPPFDDDKDYSHYHWHMEILPKTSIWGGFEWSTGIVVNIVDPEETSELLKK